MIKSSCSLHLYCDKCSDHGIYERDTLENCLRAADKDGWSVNRIIDECLCPKHSGKEVIDGS